MSRSDLLNLRAVATLAISGALPLSLVALSGCGGGEPPPAPAAQTQAVPAPAAQPAAASPAVPAASVSGGPRSSATKWIGGIPYDVFYDRPLEVASDQTGIASTAATPATPAVGAAPSPSTTAASTPMPEPGPAATGGSPPAGGGAVDWASVAPSEQLLEAITTLRNDLQTKLNTLATYNQSWESIGVDATALAAMAGVVEVHPGDVSWKPNAKFARELASQINSNAAKTGRSAYDATKNPYDNLVDLLNGNPPADVEADDQAPFGDYADRGTLMETLELTLNDVKSNITTQERLDENPAEIKRKMTVLATLMSVVSTPGYDYVAEADYQKFVKTFVDAAVAGRTAVDGKDLSSFTAAVAEMQKTCNDCHGKYAFGGDNF
ncbi:MAG: hypothetical protein KDA75_10905 [Planctomycetaceae bacterium]|nr:hypothetical protein [Planctomycetaceae bacterium]